MEDTITDGTTTSSSYRTDLFSVITAGFLWGTGGLSGAVLSSRAGIDPFAVAGHRLTIGGGLIVAWLFATGRLRSVRLDRLARRRLLALGVLAAWFQSCYFLAVELTSVSVATLVTLGAAPVLVVVAEGAVARRMPARRMLAAVAVAVCGLMLLVGGPSPDHGSGSFAGVACALASAGGFAAMTMLGARPVRGLGALPSIGLAFCLAGLITLPVAAMTGRAAVSLQPDVVLLVIFLGLVPTALAYVLYFSGLRSVATGSAALIALLEPLTAAMAGRIVLHERLGMLGVAGAVTIAVAVVLTSTQRRSTR